MMNSYDALKSDITDRLSDYPIAFFKFKENGRKAYPAGSGTLVSVGDTKAILTADHVLRNLPNTGNVGLGLPTRFGPNLHSTQVPIAVCEKIHVGNGNEKAEGPDIGLLILPPSCIPSTKTFYNLEKRRQGVIDNPLAIDIGGWVLAGAAEEWVSDAAPEAGFSEVKESPMTLGLGIVSKEYEKDGFDYLEFAVDSGTKHYEGPTSFKGFSGGGLWHMLAGKNPVLSGVAFWQSPLDGDKRIVKCHGRKSIYQRVIDAVGGHPARHAKDRRPF